MKKDSNIKLMFRMSLLVKPLIGTMLIAIVLGVVGFLCAIYIPYFAALLISHIAIKAPDFPVSVFFVMMVVLAILRGILHYGEQACNHYIAFRLLAIIRDNVFRTLRRLCPAKLEGKDSGNLIYLITSDIEALEVFYAHTISPIFIAIVTCTILLFQFYQMHILFFFIALIGYLSIGLLLPIYISKIGKEDGTASREEFGKLSNYMLESLRGIQDILQYHVGSSRLREMDHKSKELNLLQGRLKEYEGTSVALSNILIMIFTMSMLFVSSMLAIQGKVTFTSVIMTTILMLSSFGPVLALSNLSNNLLITLASARRVLALLDEVEVVEEVVGNTQVDFGDIEVQNVQFAYEEEQILKDFHASFEKGKITGILGKSGSGKSTLLKLIMRFWETQHGSIHIGNTELKDINTNNLRVMQSYVTQDTVLFHDTILNNLRIAKLDASINEVEEACKKANIHDFIMSLPMEYASKVSELGDSLSGGERQRISLARTLLHDSPCILLDEPTSNLDALNEAEILQNLASLKDKTILLVSHRPSTLQIASRVITMENGRVS